MKRPILIIALAVLFSLRATAQQTDYTATDSVLAYIKHAMLFNRSMPQEKAYLHLDNTGYFKGERIWFKAYLRRADTGEPSDISKVLYVELLNPSGDVIQKAKLKVENGEAAGDLSLDSIFGSGFYEIRAYTRYMMNFGDATAFSRVLPVFNKPKTEGDYSNPVIDQYSYRNRLPGREKEEDAAVLSAEDGKSRKAKGFEVKFYPEGGDLVQGLRSRVAFTVTDKDGMPVATKGLIMNEEDQTLAVAFSGADGRAVFEIIPEGKHLKMALTDEDGDLHTFDLPEPRAEGCVVKVDPLKDDEVTVLVSSSPAMQGRMLGYTIVNGGRVFRADTLTAEPAIEIGLNRDDLPYGVNQLTFFSSDGQIQAERLFFICPEGEDVDSVKLTADRQSITPCCKVKFDIQTAPNSHVSFSAMDAGTLTNGKQGNIHTWMLLGSEVKGYIANPDYYFEADDLPHRQAADTLMLVQGWRRYDWRLITGQTPFPKIQPIEDKLYVFGQLKPSLSAWKKKHEVSNVDLTAFLFNKSGQSLRGDCTTDSAGHYAFSIPDIDGEWNMQIQTRIDDKLKTFAVTIDRHFAPKPRFLSALESSMIPQNEANFFRPLPTGGAENESEEDKRLRVQVGHNEFVTKTVTVKAKRNYWTDSTGRWHNENEARRSAVLFYNCDEGSDELADKGETQPTLYAWLEQKNQLMKNCDPLQMIEYDNELDSFMSAVTNDSCYNFHVEGPTYNNRPTVWILNNKYAGVSGLGALMKRAQEEPTFVGQSNIEPLPMYLDEAKSVYIVQQATALDYYIINSTIQGCNPAIIFVYTHPTFSTASNKGLRKTHFQGFNVPTTFKTDDYTLYIATDDFRRTIYWQPTVQTDANGHATVEFFNNSTAKQMYVNVEGIGADGKYLVSE